MIENLEWLNRNALRAYPFAENSPRASINTGWLLPDFLVVDCNLLVQESPEGIYCSAVTITPRVVSVVLASVSTGQSLALASLTEGNDPQIEVHPLSVGVSGTLTFGPVFEGGNRETLQKHRGLHLFPTSATLETRAYLETGAFPVRGIGIAGSPLLQGTVEIEASDTLKIDVSQGLSGGDPITFFTLGLRKPGDFLSPCEIKTTACDCQAEPIVSINNVLPDESGKIEITLEDSNGRVYQMDPATLSFSLLRTGEALCRRPAMPDAYGRLPVGGRYTQDEKPVTPYVSLQDTSFPSPGQ